MAGEVFLQEYCGGEKVIRKLKDSIFYNLMYSYKDMHDSI